MKEKRRTKEAAAQQLRLPMYVDRHRQNRADGLIFNLISLVPFFLFNCVCRPEKLKKKNKSTYQPTNPHPKKKGCRERKCEPGREKKRSCKQQLKRKSPARNSAPAKIEKSRTFSLVAWPVASAPERDANDALLVTLPTSFFFLSFFLCIYTSIFILFFPFLFRVLRQNRKEKISAGRTEEFLDFRVFLLSPPP